MIVSTEDVQMLIDGVVDAQASGIQRGRIGVPHGEGRSEAVGVYRAVRQWHGSHQGPIGGRDVLPCCRCIEGADGSLWKQQPQALVGEEEKSTVPEDGTSDGPTKVVLAQSRLGKGRLVEVVASVEESIMEVRVVRCTVS